MSVEQVHPIFQNLRIKRKRCRDAFEGQDAIHDEGETYLLRLENQTDAQYKIFKERTRFFNAFKNTVTSMVGLAFRKDLVVTDPDELLPNVTGNGDSISDYTRDVVTGVLEVGGGGTLVDMPIIPDGLTVAQLERINAAPVLIRYEAENVINWKFTTVNNVRVLKLVVLRESFDSNVDEFDHDVEDRFRVLDLDEAGNYRIRLFLDGESVAESTVSPIMNNTAMKFIPFVMHGPGLPPLLDIADNNIKHYQLKADHTHGLHFVALPTPWITGVDPDDKNVPSVIGPTKLWIIPDPEAKVGMLEFEGAGLGAIKDELDAIELNMAQLGAKMLDEGAEVATTATEASINNQSSNSNLAEIIKDIEKDINLAIDYMVEWSGGDMEETFITISTDFLPNQLDPAQITALVQSWQLGAISKEQLFNNLKTGEVISADADFDEEENKIQENLPPAMVEAENALQNEQT